MIWKILMRRHGHPSLDVTRTIYAGTQAHAEMLALRVSEGAGSGWYVADTHAIPDARRATQPAENHP